MIRVNQRSLLVSKPYVLNVGVKVSANNYKFEIDERYDIQVVKDKDLFITAVFVPASGYKWKITKTAKQYLNKVDNQVQALSLLF